MQVEISACLAPITRLCTLTIAEHFASKELPLAIIPKLGQSSPGFAHTGKNAVHQFPIRTPRLQDDG